MSVRWQRRTEEVTVEVCSCDRCDTEIPPTEGYASGKKFIATEVNAFKYDAQGRCQWLPGLHVHSPAILCDACAAELVAWLYAASAGVAPGAGETP